MLLGSRPVSQETPFDLPGINLPLSFAPARHGAGPVLLPSALDSSDIQYDRASCIFTKRELMIMRLVEDITDKPDWVVEAFDKDAIAKWRHTISEKFSPEDVTTKMLDWVIKEVQWKAEQYKETGMVKSFDPGVVKFDIANPEHLRQVLQKAVGALESDIPAHEKDYRPNTDNQVVDLVHPSLFPLIYGQTKVLTDRLIGLHDCLDSAGLGVTTKKPAVSWGLNHRVLGNRDGAQPYSTRFQWLPCDVKCNADGECQIATYINNLHPVKYSNVYQALEKILTQTIPLWESTLSRKRVLPYRIPYGTVEYLPDDDSGVRRIELPEPGEFTPPPPISPEDQVPLRSMCAEKGLQVIVKLSNIELTPERPDYQGGSWHIEGNLNERICAVALYCYDSENTTESSISFRHRPNIQYIEEVYYETGNHEFLSQVFGFDPALVTEEGPATQNLGRVRCPQGRLLTFPNTLQHCISPFSLEDRSKPGLQKWLALLLVDPHLRVISTANVPPQREDWCRERQRTIQEVLHKYRLPGELQEQVQQDLGFSLITLEEGKENRLDLMAEVSLRAESLSAQFEMARFELI